MYLKVFFTTIDSLFNLFSDNFSKFCPVLWKKIYENKRSLESVILKIVLTKIINKN